MNKMLLKSKKFLFTRRWQCMINKYFDNTIGIANFAFLFSKSFTSNYGEVGERLKPTVC